MVRSALPPELKPFYFDFNWENQRVWAEQAEPFTMPIRELTWHLDVPLWSTIIGEPRFDLCPREVLLNPRVHAEHFLRLRTANLNHPLDLMWTTDRLVILDGVHRLARLAYEGRTTARVRRIPRAAIPRIRR
ncbi:MAG: hypothetical protein QNJ98_11395 [Planctomycetota bacterium]|nr:hypothetical protein [Planctomycetota bacterium]